MPHLKYLFYFRRPKRDNTSAMKMLHQMCVVVLVVVALRLVLREGCGCFQDLFGGLLGVVLPHLPCEVSETHF